MGCSVLPILFVLAMQLLLKATKNNTEIVELGGRFQMPPVKTSMDDTTIFSSKESTTHKILSLMNKQMNWCKMKFKLKKSRSLLLRKGKVNQNINFMVGGQRILTETEETEKSSECWFDESLKDINQVKEISRTLQEGLHKIDHCPLEGKFKVWCLQHIFIPMLLWLLLIYEIATRTVESIEAKMNKYTWKWFGLPPGLSDVVLYYKQAKLRLPLKSIEEEFKSGKIRLQMMRDDSKNETIKSLKPTLKTGKKWKVRETISAKDNFAFKEIIEHTQTGRQGFGTNEKQWWSTTSSKNCWHMVIQDVRSEVDDKRFLKGVQQSQQGQWTNWEETSQKFITWNDIL